MHWLAPEQSVSYVHFLTAPKKEKEEEEKKAAQCGCHSTHDQQGVASLSFGFAASPREIQHVDEESYKDTNF